MLAQNDHLFLGIVAFPLFAHDFASVWLSLRDLCQRCKIPIPLEAIQLFKSTIIGIVVLACFSCSSDSGSSQVNLSRIEVHRELDVSGKNVAVLDIDRYFSRYRYGSTLKIYHLKNENTVIMLHISNETTDFDTTAVVNIFKESVTNEAIERWINNQHSDGQYVDVPQPIGVYTLPEENLSVISHHLVDHSVEEFGDEYDNYVVEIYVDNSSEEGVYALNSFVAEINVHIRTKDIDIED
jgi:hypothetical protein